MDGKPADNALARLLAGNERFASDAPQGNGEYSVRRSQLLRDQHPLAVVLGCADSRVPPEVIFDQGLGDLFTVRVAGNVVNDAVLGSLEYAVVKLSTPLIFVLGHEGCGAVAAALNAVRGSKPPPGHIGALVHAIAPAVKPVRIAANTAPAVAVRANVAYVVEQLKAAGSILTRAVREGRLRIVGGFYDLAEGRVSIVA
ncbi:MAG: carbonic anhydrase [Candidatus Eremiobacteraeota bacterium]|nr:carbonic anhydrase [Candidatus Eremiobacteraeota bacterium]